MKAKLIFSIFLVLMLGLVALAPFSATPVYAEDADINFESYTTGSINGQDGWRMTGPYDAAIVANTYGYGSFGANSLRISNAVTSTSFGDHLFSKPLVDEAGETTAYVDAPSGARQAYFVAQWDFASADPGAEQPGLSVVASPDKGDGGRMSWIQMKDTPTGLEVNFYDYQDAEPYGTTATPEDGRGDEDDFVLTTLANGLDRTVPHTIKVEMSLIDGPHNDVVNIYVDGDLKHTGTSWEDYFRWMQGPGQPEQTAPVFESRVIRSLLFRAGGTAAPATAGKGFLIDNLKLFSGPVPTPPSALTVEVKDSLGNPIEGASVIYAVGSPNAGWQTFGVTDAEGKVSRTDMTVGTTYHFYAQYNASTSLPQQVTFDGDDTVTFQTVLVKAKVETCPGVALAGASVTYGSVNGGFLTFGATGSDGIASKELFPGYERTFYAGINATSSALQTVTVADQTDPLVTFKTTAVTFNANASINHGSANGGWYPFTKPTMEMFAGAHTFLINGTQVSAEISGCSFGTGNLTVKFPGISSVHTYVKKSDGVAGTATGQGVAEQTYKTDQAVFANLPNGVYDLVLVKGSQAKIIDDVIMFGDRTVENIVSTMTVKFPAIASVHTYVKVNDGIAGTVGGGVDERTYKNDETSLVVLKGTYDVLVVKGAKQLVVDAVDCTGETCTVENIVSIMTVNFPGIASVHSYVKVDDGAAGTASGGGVDERTYKNESTSLAVLRSFYDVIVVKGAKQLVVDAVDCTGETCTVENIVSTMTVNFPGIASVHSYVKVDDGAAGTATGGSVDERTYKNESTSLAVLRSFYDVIVVKGAKQLVVDAVDCTGPTCTVENIVSTMTVNFPGIASVHSYVKVNDGAAGTATGGSVDERTYKNDTTSLAVLRGLYDVIVVKGAKQLVVDGVDCTGPTCVVQNIVATFTLHFPGKTGVHTYIKLPDGTLNSATGGGVDERTYQNNSTSMALLKSFYDVVVKIGADTYILDDVDCTGNTCLNTLTVVKLLNSAGSGLAGGAAEYYKGGWKPIGTTPANGTLVFALPGAPATYSFKMTYTGFAQQLSANIATTNPVIFQTKGVIFKLIDSTGAALGGGAQYYASGWKDFGGGTTTTTMELLPGTYPFKVSYGGASIQKNFNIATDPNVTFQTKLVTFKLLNQGGDFELAGGAQYYASGWKTFGGGTTTTTMELLPTTYPFKVSYGGASIQKNQNVDIDPLVVFNTKVVTVKLLDSTGATDLTADADYYASGWKDFGMTPATLELLPTTYPFKVTYLGASIQKNQDVNADPVVTFNTTLVTMKLISSTNAELAGAGQFYASGWKDFGTTTTTLELLPTTYPFKVSYLGASIQKNQNVASDPNVIFATKLVTMKLLSSTGAELAGAGQFYASGWKDFGTTTSTLELLPTTYPFKVSYGGVSVQKNQNVDTDPMVLFNTKLVTMKLLDGTTELAGGSQYYASGWKPFGGGTTTTTMELLPATYPFKVTYNGAGLQKNQDIAVNPLVIFTGTKVTLQFSGNIEFYSGGWKTFTKPTTTLLPGTYPFRFSGTGFPAIQVNFTVGADEIINSVAYIRLVNSKGVGIAGGTAQYYLSSWQPIATATNGSGITLGFLPGLRSSVLFKMSYAGATLDKTQNIATDSFVIYQTAKAEIQLPNSVGVLGALPAEGTAQYYASGWKDIGPTVGGKASIELLPLSYSFAMNYAGARQEKSQNIGTTPAVVFQTTKVEIQLQDHSGAVDQLPAEGAAQYYASGWKDIGPTVDGKASIELLPLSYSFAMNYVGARLEKSQNVGTTPTVEFKTTLVEVQLQDSTGALDALPAEGTVQYYASGWKDIGPTVDGKASIELLPLSYSFAMNYVGARQEKSQNISSDALVVFKTTLVEVQLQDSAGTPGALPVEGVAQYYASGWKDIGPTVGGKASIELLPLSYSFAMNYAGARQEKSQNVGSAATVIFKTGIVHSDSGTCTQYYASGWKAFTQDMELLPGSYSFTFSDFPQTNYAIAAGTTTHIH